MSRSQLPNRKKSNKRTKSHHISEGTFLSKIFGLHHCLANEYTNTYCLSPSVLVKKKMKIPKGSKYQDRTLEKKKGSEGNAKDMPGEGILSTFSLPRKNNDQENKLQSIKIYQDRNYSCSPDPTQTSRCCQDCNYS